MKKTTKAVVVLCLCIAFLFVIAGCNQGNDLEKTVTVVIGESSYTVTTGAKYLFDVINELAQRKDDPIVLNGSWSSYGLFVTEIGTLKPANANEYIEILTTDTGHIDVTEYAHTKEYNGKTLTTASLGVSSLPLVDGEIYMFVLSSF